MALFPAGPGTCLRIFLNATLLGRGAYQMIPIGLQDTVHLPPVELNVLTPPTPHLEPCLHLADFFFFKHRQGKRKQEKNKETETHHLLSSTLLFPETLPSPRTTLFEYLEVLDVWPFKLRSKKRKHLLFSLKAPLSQSSLFLESFSLSWALFYILWT